MKILVWDFNGTIVDDARLCLNIENEMLKERGMKYGYTLDEYRDLFCFPVQEYYYKLGYTFEKESFEEISDEFNARYDKGFADCPLVDGFQELIEESHRKGWADVILSASRQDSLLKQCSILGIQNDFKEILGIENNLAASKVEMAKHWMIRSGINPDDCMYLGDTLHDMETAMAIGIKNYFLVASGHQSYKVLRQQTDRVVHSLREIQL